MADIQATMSAPTLRADLSEGMSRANNGDWALVTQNYLYNRAPEFFAHLYSVSEQEFVVSRPPVVRDMKIPGRSDARSKRELPTGERYSYITSLPQPLLLPNSNVDSGQISPEALDVRRFLTDLLNPDNLGINQDAVIDRSTSGSTNDLGAKGVFWSLNNPPKAEEVKAAVSRMEKRYRKILQEARAVEVSNPKGLIDTLSPEHHAAADYYHESYTWHATKEHKEPCPRCGQLAKITAKFHTLEGGGMCVAPDGWDMAIKAGVRTRAQAYEATDEERFAPKAPVSTPAVSTPRIPQEKV